MKYHDQSIPGGIGASLKKFYACSHPAPTWPRPCFERPLLRRFLVIVNLAAQKDQRELHAKEANYCTRFESCTSDRRQYILPRVPTFHKYISMPVLSCIYTWGAFHAFCETRDAEPILVRCNRHEGFVSSKHVEAQNLVSPQSSSWCRCYVIKDGQLCEICNENDAQETGNRVKQKLVPCQRDRTVCKCASTGWLHTILAVTDTEVLVLRDYLDGTSRLQMPRRVKQLAAGATTCNCHSTSVPRHAVVRNIFILFLFVVGVTAMTLQNEAP